MSLLLIPVFVFAVFYGGLFLFVILSGLWRGACHVLGGVASVLPGVLSLALQTVFWVIALSSLAVALSRVLP